MCDAAYISMAQVAVQAVGQSRAVSANAHNAVEAQAAAMAGLQNQTLQYDQQNTDQQVTRSRQAMTDAGAITAIFADSGLSGNSQERIARVTEGAALADEATLERNKANRADQGQADANAIRARTLTQINSVPRTSALGAGLQIAGTAWDAYDKKHPHGT
jgi:hypothetical protein